MNRLIEFSCTCLLVAALQSSANAADVETNEGSPKQKIGVVGALQPEVTAEDEAGNKRVLALGDPIYANETLRSGEKGVAQLMLNDKSALTLGNNAHIVLDRFVYDPKLGNGDAGMKVVKGSLRFIGGALTKKRQVKIKTPVSTIGIRGGIVDVQTAVNSATNAAFVYGKEMQIMDASGKVLASATVPGQGFNIPSLGAAPSALSRKQVAKLVSNSPLKRGLANAAQATPEQLNQLEKRIDINSSKPAIDKTPDEPRPTIKNPLSDEEVKTLRENPSSLLEKFPEGGPEMARYVNRAILTDPSLVDSVLSVAPQANYAQSAAMGAGIARAGRVFSQTAPSLTNQLVQQVSQSNNLYAQISFQAIGPQYQEIDLGSINPIIDTKQPLAVTIGADDIPITSAEVGTRQPNDVFSLLGSDFPTDRPTGGNGNSGLLNNGGVSAVLADEANNNDAVPVSPIR